MAISKLHNNNIKVYNTVHSNKVLFKDSSSFLNLNTTLIKL